jgi:hypothetical protein
LKAVRLPLRLRLRLGRQSPNSPQFNQPNELFRPRFTAGAVLNIGESPAVAARPVSASRGRLPENA